MSLAYKISAYNRMRKWQLFLTEFAPTPAMRVLDVGFNAEEYSNTDNFIEKHYPYPEMLTALGLDNPAKFKTRYPKVTALVYDGRSFPFDDASFDIVWSNAVLEHVGDRDRQLFFLREIKRVSKRAFITTPNRFFPIEPHTRTPLLHYLPKKIFDEYLDFIGKGWAARDYMYLLSRSELSTLCVDAGITDYKIINNRLAGFTLDFVMLF